MPSSRIGKPGRKILDLWGPEARQYLETRGFGHTVPPGKRPAVIVIDLSRAFTDPNSPAGGDMDSVVMGTARILEAARARAIPIFFATQAFMPDLSDAGTMHMKQPVLKMLTLGSPAVEIDDRLAPRPDEPIIVKKAASVFFGTPLAAMLVKRGVDTLILTGCSTSGCVRATAVDGYSYNYRLLVPHDCVGDRTPQAHTANLFDIQVKMGEVVTGDDVIAYLRKFPVKRGRGGGTAKKRRPPAARAAAARR